MIGKAQTRDEYFFFDPNKENINFWHLKPTVEIVWDQKDQWAKCKFEVNL